MRGRGSGRSKDKPSSPGKPGSAGGGISGGTAACFHPSVLQGTFPGNPQGFTTVEGLRSHTWVCLQGCLHVPVPTQMSMCVQGGKGSVTP